MNQREALDTKYWKGRNVLLTGHTGFKGSWMMTLLWHRLGANATCISLGVQPRHQMQISSTC